MQECKTKLLTHSKAVKQYKKEIVDIRKKLAAKPKEAAAAPAQNYSKGVVFRIQIGAYQGVDLQQYGEQSNFDVESAEGLQKFSIGAFRDYQQAEGLKQYLQEMGVKDAWIVSYKDGVRVNINEATGTAATAN